MAIWEFKVIFISYLFIREPDDPISLVWESFWIVRQHRVNHHLINTNGGFRQGVRFRSLILRLRFIERHRQQYFFIDSSPAFYPPWSCFILPCHDDVFALTDRKTTVNTWILLNEAVLFSCCCCCCCDIVKSWVVLYYINYWQSFTAPLQQ